ncbi:Spc98 family-domain-containing protein [Radiomyces spectabilis]|uniref:Spc98 family-domain-containing protein n=1 Tax=Radiomyces spectabilis TaxID=64574 RepID=UPI0022206FEE|nr:Spc98 family-domain-containing protein [Radiomyces spectabilis]KAI8377771.1 Spc98 family-domain-containing protein [Radiomyces spectabilis]
MLRAVCWSFLAFPDPLLMSATDLLQQLILRVTNRKSDHVDPKILRDVERKLQYHKFTSSDNYQLDTRYENLSEKFYIKGRNDLANALRSSKSRFLQSNIQVPTINDPKSLKYDILGLLLALSGNPLAHPPRSLLAPEAKVSEAQLWKDVLREEPLQGSHWEQWNDLSSDDEPTDPYSDDDFTLDFEQLAEQKRRLHYLDSSAVDPVDSFSEEETGNNDIHLSDISNDVHRLEILKTRQYWQENYKRTKRRQQCEEEEEEDSAGGPLMRRDSLQNASQLYPTLSRYRYAQHDTDHVTFVHEMDVIREVLFLLRGYEGVLFQRKTTALGEQQFEINQDYVLRHLSHSALHGILQQFCKDGILLSNLRMWAQRMVKASTVVAGQTCQAFGACLMQIIGQFDLVLGQREMKYKEDAAQMISILQLRHSLETPLQSLRILHDIIAHSPFMDTFTGNSASQPATPHTIAVYLISELYSRLLSAQSMETNVVYTTLLSVFQQTFAPYGRLMDDWTFYGSLQGDMAGEFLVAQRRDLDENSSLFWSQGFYIKEAPDALTALISFPLFTEHHSRRVLFTGKAVYLTLKLGLSNSVLQQYNTFETVLHNTLARTDDISMEEYHSVQHNSGDPWMHPFMQHSFPLATTSSSIKDRSPLPAPGAGQLLDQAMQQCFEHYVGAPYEDMAVYLKNILLAQCGLLQHLQSLSSIYLLLHNDVMHTFLENLFIQMDQQRSLHDPRLLNKLLAEACSTGHESPQNLLIIKLKSKNHTDASEPMNPSVWLQDIHVMYELPWPVNNFIRSEYIEEYNHIFTLVSRLKRAKYVLETKCFIRMQHQASRNQNLMELYSMRMRLMWFVNAFWSYIMTTVLHAETIQFRDYLSQLTDADEITALHGNFVRRIVNRCLLNEETISIKRAIMSVMALVEDLDVLFACCTGSSSTGLAREKATTQLDALKEEFEHTIAFINDCLGQLRRQVDTLAASLSVS